MNLEEDYTSVSREVFQKALHSHFFSGYFSRTKGGKILFEDGRGFIDGVYVPDENKFWLRNPLIREHN